MLLDEANDDPQRILYRGKSALDRGLTPPDELARQGWSAPKSDLYALACAAEEMAGRTVRICADKPGPLALLAAGRPARVDLFDRTSASGWRALDGAAPAELDAPSVCALKAGGLTPRVAKTLDTLTDPAGDLLVYDLDENTLDSLLARLTGAGLPWRLVPTHRRVLTARWRDARERAALFDRVVSAGVRQSRVNFPKKSNVDAAAVEDACDLCLTSLRAAGLDAAGDRFESLRTHHRSGPVALGDLLSCVRDASSAHAPLAWLLSDPTASRVLRAEVDAAAMADLYRVAYGIGEFAHALGNLHARGSRLYDALRAGEIGFGDTVPHATKPEAHYDFFYATRDLYNTPARGLAAPTSDTDTERSTVSGPFGPVFKRNQALRKAQAIANVEFLLYEISLQFPSEPLRWLDLGCGDGTIVNNVRPNRYTAAPVRAVGIEASPALVAQARSAAGPDREFFQGDARDLPRDLCAQGFHLITACEFLEHLFDPLAVLAEVRPLCRGMLLAGSPLAEPVGFRTDPAHIWSFRRRGYERMFELSGYRPIYGFETFVGSYHGGHDWLTVVARPEA